MESVDRIEKRVVLRAPVTRVWQALTDAAEFGCWFGVRLQGEFTVGKPITGFFDEGFDETQIMDYQRQLGVPPAPIRIPDAGIVFCSVVAMEPEQYFSFRWIPFGIEAGIDPAREPTTLIEFRLTPVPDGTQLDITESGFAGVPAHRRLRAFRMNDAGWMGQAERIRRYVERA